MAFTARYHHPPSSFNSPALHPELLTYHPPSDICKIILAIFLPPVGVFLERGCGADFLINILLTILGYIPGIIHALYIILKY
ncbi:plasma membrane proteolipid Pmp3 [Pseudogymnoascus destructans]|uniref:Plasma membrane proteolipid Pmp3 n=1 Tax=Pseudogymnoascus destructans TaxID=655981 RepID=A0A177A1C3_9PEZI|nr:plasma membrane proteolipid Pmp3 [Pseudogymnoascus destructans]OAF55081.2 plasma membrane proteolipid Pmp3 [Pseudogymnoascus destructans]